MTVAFWIAVVLAGVVVTIAASRRAVREAARLAAKLDVPPFFVGLTVVAIGTDLPEIANSIIASATQHGDLNVGDSVGSAVTQVTLVLGLLPLLAGPFKVDRGQVLLPGLLTALALLLGVALVADGRLSRLDGCLLVLSWLACSLAVWKWAPMAPPALAEPDDHPAGAHGLRALFFFALVAVGAAGVVTGFARLSAILGVPEYVISFLVTSIGTSLPELVVDFSALRQRAADLAIGDLFGSSLVDSTLSLGIGPLLIGTPVTAALAVRGGLAASVALALVTLLLWRVRRHDWRTGLLLLLVYAAFYPLLIG